MPSCPYCPLSWYYSAWRGQDLENYMYPWALWPNVSVSVRRDAQGRRLYDRRYFRERNVQTAGRRSKPTDLEKLMDFRVPGHIKVRILRRLPQRNLVQAYVAQKLLASGDLLELTVLVKRFGPGILPRNSICDLLYGHNYACPKLPILVRALLDWGCSPNGRSGQNSVQKALWHEDVSLAQTLLRAGAETSTLEGEFRTPLLDQFRDSVQTTLSASVLSRVLPTGGGHDQLLREVAQYVV